MKDDAGRIVLDYKHATLAELRDSDLLPRAQLRELFTFATVRNPFDSLVSLYSSSGASTPS